MTEEIRTEEGAGEGNPRNWREIKWGAGRKKYDPEAPDWNAIKQLEDAGYVTISLREAAEYAGVGKMTIRYWITNGLLPAERIANHWVIKRSDLDKRNEESKRFAGGKLRGKRGRVVPED